MIMLNKIIQFIVLSSMNRQPQSANSEQEFDLPSLDFEFQLKFDQFPETRKAPQGNNLFESLISTGHNQQPFYQGGTNLAKNSKKSEIDRLSINDFAQQRRKNGDSLRCHSLIKRAKKNKEKVVDDEYIVSSDEEPRRYKNQRKNRNFRLIKNAKNLLVSYKTIFREYLEKHLPKQQIPEILFQKQYLKIEDAKLLLKNPDLRPYFEQMFSNKYVDRQIQISHCKDLKTKIFFLEKAKQFQLFMRGEGDISLVM